MFKKHVYNQVSEHISIYIALKLANIRGVLIWQGI